MSTPLRERPPTPARAEIPTLRALTLAQRLATMLPQVTDVHIRLQDGRTSWPHLDVRATGSDGQAVRISRTQAHVAARWIIRTYPEANWAARRTFDLRSGALNGGAA
ncbi:transcriptional regulator [Streptomyces sp. NBC_01233]|uniref:transcriptional regulator n=1 Tax=Streptomyces sp. NBC_01233 TaxID=2903787 RepID=UPI002E128CE9|nr:transcriptional regulator [Streptomyces sp. NBC_01233]